MDADGIGDAVPYPTLLLDLPALTDGDFADAQGR